MSLTFTATFLGDKFKVEVTRDGDLVFLDHDVTFDIAAHEFGYPKTTAIKLFNKWKEFPIQVVTRTFDLTEKQLVTLEQDWAQHIIETAEHKLRLEPGGIKLSSDGLDELQTFLDEASDASEVAARAAWAAGFNAADEQSSPVWKASYTAEVAWQVRRFVDVMGAIGQGLPWPPMEATP